ncbi:MAG TPA: hypothetical protein VG165_06460 [Solirubrobacteraceae bacterium]|jgi:hypothetical protein|nr:hypothetical protein [Solirubrobacteraceae bacterium]
MKAAHEERHGPPRRAEGLVVERVGAELLVYDPVSSLAHCLTADAAAVFDACDCAADRAALCAAAGLPVETVDRALGELAELGLVDVAGEPIPPIAGERVRRREALKRLAKASAAATAAPLIFSVVLGTPAAFASGGSQGEGDPCTPSGVAGVDDCATGFNCDPAFNVCVSQNCDLVAGPCANGDTCINGTFSGNITVVGYGTGCLCC